MAGNESLRYAFSAYGHENITSTHKTTLEFTKDSACSVRGDCIVGVSADFNHNQLTNFIKEAMKNKEKNNVKVNSQDIHNVADYGATANVVSDYDHCDRDSGRGGSLREGPRHQPQQTKSEPAVAQNNASSNNTDNNENKETNKNDTKNTETNRENESNNEINNIKVKITISSQENIDSITGFLNPSFSDPSEIVVRRSDYLSSRTLVWGADKAACDLSVKAKGEDKITVVIEIL